MFSKDTIPLLKKNLLLFFYLLVILCLEFSKGNSILIEDYYSSFLYKISSNVSLYVFGKFPFSIGDILYIIFPIILYSQIKSNYTRRQNLKNFFHFITITYIIFQFQWGLNYHRTPLEKKLSLGKNIELKSLIKVTDLFITNTNKIHHKLSKNDTLPVLFDDSSLYKESIRAIQTLKKHNISKDKPPLISVKNSLFSTPLSYMGFSGYINPFTLEAQINKNIPKIQVPTTICHEIAHQMGYSAENEANFIGIMAAIHSENNLVSYSGNTLALRHLLNELYKSDKKSHHLLISKVNKGILINFIEANKEWEKYNNPFEPYFKGLFDYFLKVNNQTEGVKSYNLVVNLLVNYYSN